MRLRTPRRDPNFCGFIGTHLYKQSLKQNEREGGRKEGKKEGRKEERKEGGVK